MSILSYLGRSKELVPSWFSYVTFCIMLFIYGQELFLDSTQF
jgi:hypothetical protein